MNDKLDFRKFNRQDIDLLYTWANDPLTRSNSFHTEKIQYIEHVKWCEARLVSDELTLYIVYSNGIPVAQLRIDYDNDKAFISYSVDNKYRGIGLGKRIIESIEIEKLYYDHEVTQLIGEVKLENIASQKVFEHCLYIKQHENDRYRYIKYINR